MKKYGNEMSSTGIIIIPRVVVGKPAKELQREDTQRRHGKPKVIFISIFRCVGTISKRDLVINFLCSNKCTFFIITPI
jgi:hypothetical protein